jgi:hypothetical protein
MSTRTSYDLRSFGGQYNLSLEENKALILSLYEANNKKDLSILNDVI